MTAPASVGKPAAMSTMGQGSVSVTICRTLGVAQITVRSGSFPASCCKDHTAGSGIERDAFLFKQGNDVLHALQAHGLLRRGMVSKDLFDTNRNSHDRQRIPGINRGFR